MGFFGNCLSWIDIESCSDHHSIWLQLDEKSKWKPLPFKFNHGWLKDKGIFELVKNTWIPFTKYSNDGALSHLLYNLKILKRTVQKMGKEKIKGEKCGTQLD